MPRAGGPVGLGLPPSWLVEPNVETLDEISIPIGQIWIVHMTLVGLLEPILYTTTTLILEICVSLCTEGPVAHMYPYVGWQK